MHHREPDINCKQENCDTLAAHTIARCSEECQIQFFSAFMGLSKPPFQDGDGLPSGLLTMVGTHKDCWTRHSARMLQPHQWLMGKWS